MDTILYPWLLVQIIFWSHKSRCNIFCALHVNIYNAHNVCVSCSVWGILINDVDNLMFRTIEYWIIGIVLAKIWISLRKKSKTATLSVNNNYSGGSPWVLCCAYFTPRFNNPIVSCLWLSLTVKWLSNWQFTTLSKLSAIITIQSDRDLMFNCKEFQIIYEAYMQCVNVFFLLYC